MSDNLYSNFPKTTIHGHSSSMLKVSADGYIRLSFTELKRVQLEHLISGLDDDEVVGTFEGASRALITGYTEWLSTGSPKITLGWDWEMVMVQGGVGLRRIGAPRSNLMLQDGSGNDLGYEKSLLLIELYVDEMSWKSLVLEQIRHRYG